MPASCETRVQGSVLKGAVIHHNASLISDLDASRLIAQAPYCDQSTPQIRLANRRCGDSESFYGVLDETQRWGTGSEGTERRNDGESAQDPPLHSAERSTPRLTSPSSFTPSDCIPNRRSALHVRRQRKRCRRRPTLPRAGRSLVAVRMTVASTSRGYSRRPSQSRRGFKIKLRLKYTSSSSN